MIMKSDRDIERDVRAELSWDPRVSGTHVTVTASDGIVTLSGDVPSYAKKLGVARTAERVSGVRAVVQHLDVRLPDTHAATDGDLASGIAAALRWDLEVPDDDVKVAVENGWVTLTGAVDWGFQRSAAERALRYLRGIRGVTNAITVHPTASAVDVKQRIEHALERSAETDARKITVEARDGAVTLRGTVHSWVARQEATRAAWAAPGVREVNDALTIAF
jgi:osmotically-inducible protein OsmY